MIAMTMIATASGPEFPKARLAGPQRNWLIAGVAAAVVHVIMLVVLVLARVEQAKADPDPTMEVSLIPAAAFAPEDLKRPPSAPTPPKPVALQPELEKARPTPLPDVMPEVTRAASIEPSPAPTQANAPASAAPPGPPVPATTPPSFTAAYLKNPGPQYPYEARAKRQEGIVKLKVLVTPDGLAEQVVVERSSGFPTLDEAAMDVVKRRWRFVPAKQEGRAIAGWVVVPMAFSLKNR